MAEDPAAKGVSLVNRVAGANVPAGYERTAVPAGYKRTEVGVIPENWDVVSLGELFVFKNGLNKAKHFFGHGTPIVNYMDVFGHPGLTMANLSGRVSLCPQEIANFKVQQGDVFFTRTSETVEDIGVASVMLDDPDSTVFSGFVLRARSRNERLIDRYKQYCFTLRSVRSQIVSNATYTTRALTNGRSLSAVRIAVPTEPEQHAIAEALSDVDGLIESLEALIAKKQAVKTAAMQQLLTGKTRLPGFSGEWEKKKIGDFTDCTAGGTPSTLIAEYWGGAIRWMNSGELKNKIIRDVEGRITERGLRASSAKLVPSGCVLVGLAGQGKTRGTVAFSSVELCTNQSIAAIYPNQRAFVSEYLYHNLTYRYEELRRISKGDGGRGGLNLHIIRSLDVLFPAIDEQRAIAAILSDMDAEIVALENRLDKVRALKQGMMQQLLTGRIRLPATDKLARGQAESVEGEPVGAAPRNGGET